MLRNILKQLFGFIFKMNAIYSSEPMPWCCFFFFYYYESLAYQRDAVISHFSEDNEQRRMIFAVFLNAKEKKNHTQITTTNKSKQIWVFIGVWCCIIEYNVSCINVRNYQQNMHRHFLFCSRWKPSKRGRGGQLTDNFLGIISITFFWWSFSGLLIQKICTISIFSLGISGCIQNSLKTDRKLRAIQSIIYHLYSEYSVLFKYMVNITTSSTFLRISIITFS